MQRLLERPRAGRVLYAVTDPTTAILVRGQMAYLKSAGFDVHFACRPSPYLRRLAVEEGFTLHDIPLSRSWIAVDDVKGLWRAVRVLREVRPDVLNYSTPKASLIWAIASRLSRPGFVVYLLRGLRLESERPRSAGFVFLWLTELIASLNADVVLCVSEELRRKAIDLRLVRAARAVVLGKGSSNGVCTERFSPSPELRSSMRKRLGLAEAEVVVGFVGRFVEEKGLYDLLDALTVTTENVRCLLVGDSELDVDIATVLEERGLADRVTVIDFTHDVRDYYAAMDMVVLPSHREGLPNALLEAQAMGLPCVTTDATGCRDAVAVSESALVVPVRAPHELARAIDRLARDAQLRARFGAAGRTRVLEHFRQADLWERYAQLYSGGRGATAAKAAAQAGGVA